MRPHVIGREMEENFDAADLKQIRLLGLTEEDVNEQIIRTLQGFPRTPVMAAARPNDGIRQVSVRETDRYIGLYENFEGTSTKFVPASGMASRMFSRLYEYLNDPDPDVNPFGEPLVRFPFATILGVEFLRRGVKVADLESAHNYVPIIRELLDKNKMGYGDLPKLLLPFHRLPNGTVRTPLEEHLVEAAQYTKGRGGEACVHFTITPSCGPRILGHFDKVKPLLEKEYNTSFKVKWSSQDRSTDTIALTLDGKPYRDAKGRLLFRPAGHGALLSNLQDTDQDIIFIKNVDNVAPDHLKPEMVRYKRVLAGILIELREQIHGFMRQLDSGHPTEADCERMLEFCRKELFMRLPTGVKDAPFESKVAYLRNKLNRPLRVCGVVQNMGEPGGGPYWVRERDGGESLQIVETSQMDVDVPRVIDILKKAKYFNPVDIVCCIRNYRGVKFALADYVNPSAGFIVRKDAGGVPVQSVELPGLWNGAMANWNTVFVEVPAITFTPVKELEDLARPEHQPESAS